MIIFVIPAYNEEKNIERVLAELDAHCRDINLDYKAVIADDASKDKTAAIVKSLKNKVPVFVVSNPFNMGPGAAFDLGFREAIKISTNGDIVVTMEADSTSDLKVLDEMIKRVQGGYDVALASCYMKSGGVEGTTLYRKILSSVANFLVGAILHDTKVKTFSSFYRAYKIEILRKAYEVFDGRFIEEKGFACAVEIFLKLHKLGANMCEVPMVLKCHKRVGKSKMKTLKTITAYFRLFLKMALQNGFYGERK